MSSQGSPALDLDVHARRAERRVAMLVLMTGVLAPWLLQVTIPTSLLLSASAAIGLSYGFRQAGWLAGPRRLVRITWLGDRRWFLTDARGLRREATLLPDTRRGPGCVWLRWRLVDAPDVHSMLLVRTDLATHELRRLLVRLFVDGMSPAQPTFLDDPAAPRSPDFYFLDHLRRKSVKLRRWFHSASAISDTVRARVASSRHQ